MKTISLVKQVVANGDNAIDKICDVLEISDRKLSRKFLDLATDADSARQLLRLHISNGIDDDELRIRAERGVEYWTTVYQLTQKAMVYFSFKPSFVRDSMNPRTKAGTIRLLDELSK